MTAMADVAEAKALLGSKLSERQLRKFRDEDYSQLASAGFCDLESFEAATSELLMVALPGRPGLVAVLLKAFAHAVPSDISLFWGSLTSAKEVQQNIEVDSNIVASSISLSSPAGLPAYKRRRAAKVEVVSNTLKLKGGTRFPHTWTDELYVRNVYVKFTELAFTILKGEFHRVTVHGTKQLVRHLFVTGSPGNGKTSWGFYLLYRLAKEDSFSSRPILWEDYPERGRGISYYFKGTDVRIGFPGDFDTLVDENSIILVNGPVLRSRQMVSQIIMFCSAKDAAAAAGSWQVTKDAVKHTVYMPMWDLCELVLAGTIAGRSYDDVREYYKKFGGSARSVLLQFADPEWHERFEKTLAAVKDRAALTYTVGSMLQAKESRSFIFHLKVTNDECTDTAVVFASRYVEETILSLAKLDDLTSVVEYVNRNKFRPDEAALVGKRLEFLFHGLLSCSTASDFVFKTRRMGSDVIVDMRFALTGKSGTFDKLDNIPDGSLGYFVPDYETYPCYDSILFLKDDVNTSAFQVTRDTRHPALLDYVEKLVEGHLVTKFFYAVPEEIFMEFPRQGSAEVAWPAEVAVWVLQIPSDFLNFHKQQDTGLIILS